MPIRGLREEPWCIGQDFNVVWFPYKRKNGNYLSRAMRNFSSFIEEYNLVDLPSSGCVVVGSIVWCIEWFSCSLF